MFPVNFKNGCLYFPPSALYLACSPGPGHWPCSLALVLNLYLPALALYLYLRALASNLYLPVQAPNLCLSALAPNLYLTALVYILLPVLYHQFLFVLTALSYDLYYRARAWICIYFIIVSCNSSSSNFFGIDNANICMLIWKTSWNLYAHRLLSRLD